ELRVNTGAQRIVVTDNVATGVQLGADNVIAAERVISDYDARHTFTQLVAPPELEPEVNHAVRHIRYNGAVARVNLALGELPSFPEIRYPLGEALHGTLVLAPSLTQLEKAFDSAKYGDVSDYPYLEVSIPSLSDPSLAPAGQHVMSIWFQYAPYRSSVAPE